jgi:hypothetical protein
MEREMKVWRDKTAWSDVSAKVVSQGSQQQMQNVLEMAIQDILSLHQGVNPDRLNLRPIDETIVFRPNKAWDSLSTPPNTQ